MKLVKTPLSTIEYFTEDCSEIKSQIVLHHTVSSKGKGINVKTAFDADRGKSLIAVPYVVDIDDIIYELFDPKFYAYHLGVPKVDNKNLCKKSIAIEIVNEGPLTTKNGKYYWFDGKYEYKGDVFRSTEPWRGYSYFAAYSEKQIQTTAELVKILCERFNIQKNVITHNVFDISLLEHNGVINHSNVRRDKTDLHPGFDFNKFKEFLK